MNYGYKKTGEKVQMASKTRIFFLNALSLTATALIIRAVSVIFNIYISNRAGSETMGLFSLLGSVYTFAMTVAMAGINLGTTRLVSDAIGIGDMSLAKRSVRRALWVCTVTSSAAGVLLFSLSSFLGSEILGDTRAISSLRILALTLFPVSICSCLSGYFTAVRRVKVNAAFQLLGQFVRIFATVILLSFLVDLGTEEACIALVVGGAVSEFVSLIITFLLYLFDLRKLSSCPSIGKTEATNEEESCEKTTKKLLGITLPVTFSACIRSALSMVQHILIPKGIKASGRSWSEALSSYGALHGMALPLLLFPSAFISAFAGLLIPEISECCVQNNTSRLLRVSYRAFGLSLCFSIGVSGIMLFFSHELGMSVYNNQETAFYIRILAPLIPVMYIDATVDAILKGSGHHVYSMNINIADTLTACIFAIILIPKIGIWGYIISIYATEILNTTLSLIKMMSVSHMKPRIFHQVLMPVVCIIGATNIASIVFHFIPIFSNVLDLVLKISLSAFIYILLLFVTGTLGKDESEFFNASLLSQKTYDRKFRQGQI